MEFIHASRLLSVQLYAPAFQLRNINLSIQLCRTHYDTLGLDKKATIKQIKEAYYTKSKLCHPDNLDGNATEFLELKQAYDVLRRPAERRSYDLFLNGIYTARAKSRPNYHGQNWNTYWQHEFYRPFRESEKAKREAEVRTWRNIFWFTFAGVVLISIYNFSIWYKIIRIEKDAEQLSAKDEIAKCFLRQREYRDQLGDSLQLNLFARLLREDIERAQRLKEEERRLVGFYNPKEIREEERWMAAVRTPVNPDRQRPIN